MKIKHALLFIPLVVFAITCKPSQELVPSRTRTLKPSEISAYHETVTMRIGWLPYQEQTLEKTKDDNWVVVKNDDTDKKGAVPVILVSYPDGRDSILLDMNMDSELLGKLVKHTLMTQEPITEPFSEYFEVAKCTKCHPSDVPVDFNKD